MMCGPSSGLFFVSFFVLFSKLVLCVVLGSIRRWSCRRRCGKQGQTYEYHTEQHALANLQRRALVVETISASFARGVRPYIEHIVGLNRLCEE